jgi:thiamine kinase-like enzyme
MPNFEITPRQKIDAQMSIQNPSAIWCDLEHLLETEGLQIVDKINISPRPSIDPPRNTLKILCSNGLTFKARRLETQLQAEKVWNLAQQLPSDTFAKIFAWHGTAFLEQWLDGITLAELSLIDPTFLRRAGEILGLFHSGFIPIRKLPISDTSSQTILNKLSGLIQMGILSEKDAKNIFEIANKNKPATSDFGFCHGDFCAENLILQANGQLFVIDPECLDMNYLDHDIARTWYRWPMSQADFNMFLEGYRTYRNTLEFFNHRAYWAITVLIDSIRFRIRTRTKDILYPLNLLLNFIQ